ncbi:hypothetical protein HZ326_5110 [Fusarium oxysporum f. sp. albedinis]|nr:hypothetical protein HZ326_5110 [Fusarium oxysporum f. sp. albedinis]
MLKMPCSFARSDAVFMKAFYTIPGRWKVLIHILSLISESFQSSSCRSHFWILKNWHYVITVVPGTEMIRPNRRVRAACPGLC